MTYLRYLSLVVRKIGFYPVIVEHLFFIILSKPYKRNLRLSCHSIIQDSLPFRNHFLSKKLTAKLTTFSRKLQKPIPRWIWIWCFFAFLRGRHFCMRKGRPMVAGPSTASRCSGGTFGGYAGHQSTYVTIQDVLLKD